MRLHVNDDGDDDNLTPWHVLECVALANVWCCSDKRD